MPISLGSENTKKRAGYETGIQKRGLQRDVNLGDREWKAINTMKLEEIVEESVIREKRRRKERVTEHVNIQRSYE